MHTSFGKFSMSNILTIPKIEYVLEFSHLWVILYSKRRVAFNMLMFIIQVQKFKRSVCRSGPTKLNRFAPCGHKFPCTKALTTYQVDTLLKLHLLTSIYYTNNRLYSCNSSGWVISLRFGRTLGRSNSDTSFEPCFHVRHWIVIIHLGSFINEIRVSGQLHFLRRNCQVPQNIELYLLKISQGKPF